MQAKTNDSRVIWLSIVLELFAATALLATRTELSGLEEHIFRAIYGHPGGLRVLALAVTQLGSAWVLLGFSGLLFAVRRLPNLGLQVLRNGLLAYVLTVVIKELVGRPRPAELLTNVSQHETVLRGLGFPSAHTALATAVVFTIWPYVPAGWRWIGVVSIGAVAWSRIYLGVHLPLDILGGLLIGVAVVLLAAYLPQKGVWKSEPTS